MKQKLFLLLSLLFTIAIITPTQATIALLPVNTSTDPDPVQVKSAVEAFKNLSKKERKGRIKEVKKQLKAFKAEKKAGNDADTNTLLLVILAILLPPLAVYLYEGEINNRFWISLLLTLLFWLPGVIYALILILGNE
jgi:uncharacterized membrane protein YqaE (UPF0057 family)